MNKLRETNETVERWKDIPGFEGRYQASTYGRIRRVWQKSGNTRLMQPYTREGRKKHANRSSLRVHLTMANGKRVERSVISLVAETFLRVPKDKHAVHRNGLMSDNSVSNIIFLSNRELGARFGAMSSRHPVAKINRDGEVIACYPSARTAAKENHMSYQTIIDRCNNKIKKPFALDGFNYKWDKGLTDGE